MKSAVIGVDIGGTKIAAHLSSDGLRSIVERTIPCPARDGAQTVIQAVVALCRELISAGEKEDWRTAGIGVGAAGQIDPVRGVVIGANDNLSGWPGTPIADTLSRHLNLPVYVENDVRSFALAESMHGAASGDNFKCMLFVAIGTGIGGALIMDGRLWQGKRFGAGEVGFLRVSRGDDGRWLTVEESAAGPPMERAYLRQQPAGTPHLSLRDIATRAQNGDKIAQDVIREGASLLGGVLAPVLCLLDPDALIVGGGVPQIGSLWWDPFEAALRDFPMEVVRQVPVLRAQLGPRAAMIGASTLCLKRLEDSVIAD